MNDEGLEYLRHKAAKHQNIEHWAYQNWQWRGSPIGSPEVDWFLAEKEYIERGLRMARVQCFSLRLLWAPLNSKLHSNLAPTLGLQTEWF